MYRWLLAGCLLVLAQGAVSGQQMRLFEGTVTVVEGTSMQLVGPLEWTIDPGASVINNGTIVLGDAAKLFEPAGGPITGTGTETAILTAPAPYSNEEPGNLGLELSSTTGPAPITVVRGHLPRQFAEGDSSIARWYQLQADPLIDGSVDAVLSYDPTELNGLAPNSLSLYRSDDLLGPWTMLASTPNAGINSVSGMLSQPAAFLTAFDMDAPTPSPTLVAQNGFSVFPTVINDVVNVVSLDHQPIQRVQLFDGIGRTVPLAQIQGGVDRVQLALPALASGAYFLRVNDQHAFKLRVP